MNGKQILIVSQDQDILMFLQDRLTQMEFDVLTFSNSLQWDDLFKAPFIKGILLDLEMSSMDGMSMLKYLRRLNPAVPIVALSIHENVMGLVHAVEEGATDFMLKPIDSRVLKEKCALLFD